MINKTRIKCQSKTDTIGKVHTHTYLKKKAINSDGDVFHVIRKVKRNESGNRRTFWRTCSILITLSYHLSSYVHLPFSLYPLPLVDKFDKLRKIVDVSIKRKKFPCSFVVAIKKHLLRHKTWALNFFGSTYK